ncbi:MAG: pectinesterase family protein [Bacteroidia bacterium]
MKKSILFSLLIAALCVNFLFAENQKACAVDIIVAADGSGDYTTVQAAIDAAPDNDTAETIILVKKGTYQEKILIGASKTHLTLLGENVDSTILVWDDYSGRVVNGTTLGTSTSYSFRVDADYFKAENITFENSAVQEAQAVAVLVNGDKNIFYHCRLIGNQDTYYTKGDGRIYMKDCYIEGTTDFIFGKSVVVFDSCMVQSKKTSYITAASTDSAFAFGYVFFDCQLTAEPGILVWPGCPKWPFARTVFFHSYMGRHIVAQGWSDWSGNNNHLYGLLCRI